MERFSGSVVVMRGPREVAVCSEIEPGQTGREDADKLASLVDTGSPGIVDLGVAGMRWVLYRPCGAAPVAPPASAATTSHRHGSDTQRTAARIHRNSVEERGPLARNAGGRPCSQTRPANNIPHPHALVGKRGIVWAERVRWSKPCVRVAGLPLGLGRVVVRASAIWPVSRAAPARRFGCGRRCRSAEAAHGRASQPLLQRAGGA